MTSFRSYSALLFLILISQSANAGVIGRIVKSTGDVKVYRGKHIISPRLKEEIYWGDEIKGAEGATVSIWLPRQEMQARGPFRFVLEKSTGYLDISIVQIYEGQLRMRTRNISPDGKAIPVAMSENSKLSVRGNSEFVVSFEPLMGETELYGLSQKTDLAAIRNTTASTVAENQWIGLGGRFTTRVRPIVELQPEIFTHLKTLLPIE